MSSPPAPAPAPAPALAPNPLPPSTTAAAATAPPSPPTPPSEPHLLSSLAQLQTLHLQLQHLRSTIPRLLLPLLTPHAHASPEEFYDAVRRSAVGAGEEVERFREGWEGEEARAWRGRAREAGRVGWRGGDEVEGEEVGWVDEEGGDAVGGEVGVEDGGGEEEGVGGGGVGIEEVEGVVGRWREGRDGVQVEVAAEGREIMVSLPPPARIHFHISATSTPDQTTAFEITCKEAAQVHKAVLRSVAARPRPHDLEYLLDMLASYKDIKERPCRACGKLLDNGAMFPIVRRRKRTKNEDGIFESNWEALHEGCS